mmetsp:Transcript_107811/g.301893  ORF Transcript_107811/g.301893 Transcript_107811/m.301893 type:complete len:102 (-) Transcript_107811:502-807(-)
MHGKAITGIRFRAGFRIGFEKIPKYQRTSMHGGVVQWKVALLISVLKRLRSGLTEIPHQFWKGILDYCDMNGQSSSSLLFLQQRRRVESHKSVHHRDGSVF